MYAAIALMLFCQTKHTKAERLSIRIYNHRASQIASTAISWVGNGCAAHPSRQVLTLHLKTCSPFALFTSYDF
jgi:hypothetical protein